MVVRSADSSAASIVSRGYAEPRRAFNELIAEVVGSGRNFAAADTLNSQLSTLKNAESCG
jgi:hypothetical protein